MNEQKQPRFYRYGSIEQFKSVVKNVRDYCSSHSKPLPTLTFTGSVKLHGTNAAIAYHAATGEITFQSRERILTVESDNAGFAQYASEYTEALRSWLATIHQKMGGEAIVAYGEWAGPKVQQGVGVSELYSKQFFAFDIRSFTGDERVKLAPLQVRDAVRALEVPGFHCIYQFPTWRVCIDFAAPELVQNELVELTVAVETECPVAKTFGISGIGEGLVWRCDDAPEIKGLTFKVKGEKHSASKVRVLKEIAAPDVARLESVKQFLELVVTPNRLAQGLAKLGEMGLPVDSSSTGAYIRWVVQDVKTEEALTIEASGFSVGEIMHRASGLAKNHYMRVLASA